MVSRVGRHSSVATAIVAAVICALSASAAPAAKCGATAGAVRQKTDMIPPDARNWCWAASAEMVMNALEPRVAHRQCAQANERFQRQDCCISGRPNDCEKPAGGIPPLREFSSVASTAALTPDRIFQEICVDQHPFLIITPAAGVGP